MSLAPPAAADAQAREGQRVQPAALQRWLLRQAGRAAPWLHGEIARRMAERLSLIRLQPAQVIDWWAHAGASDAFLKRQHPQARRIAVEPHRAGVEAASGWWQRLRRRPLSVTEDSLPAAPPAQMLWANMVLHWSDDWTRLLQRWASLVQTDGVLMFSCFGPDTLRELRALYRRLDWGPVGTEAVDMHDIGDALVQAGWADPVMDMEMLRLTWPDPQALLDELRTLGCNTAPTRFAGLRTPRWRQTWMREVETGLRGPDGRIALSFEIIYGHAFRPAPRPDGPASTAIPLDELRQQLRRRSADRGRGAA